MNGSVTISPREANKENDSECGEHLGKWQCINGSAPVRRLTGWQPQHTVEYLGGICSADDDNDRPRPGSSKLRNSFLPGTRPSYGGEPDMENTTTNGAPSLLPAPRQPSSVSNFVVHLPPFTRTRAVTWFQQAEPQFSLARIIYADTNLSVRLKTS